MTVDVAIPSFRKPESLIFTLLTLHRHSAASIGTVWITDDSSDDGTLDVLRDPALAERLHPWRLDLHETRRRGGSGNTLVTPAMALRLLGPGLAAGHRLRSAYFLLTRGLFQPQSIRYERALARSRAEFVLLLHDDVEIRGDVATFMERRMETDPRLAIAGPLGQCWRCGLASGCAPEFILAGGRPTPDWPVTPPPASLRRRRRDRACRINEWCCMIRVAAARELARDGIHFGNNEDGGDIGAYWFASAIARGWRFTDPFRPDGSDPWFLHPWQGHSGRSVWADQGNGRKRYDAAMIRARIADEFGFVCREKPGP
ncbi:glycosyltransferase family 2 protein [Rhodobacter sp. CZR27]|uniref:glycosyltransferase family 2 protein n=1 Tax=Rhodobacter sp. CZR27 TaxID=2033869 RepID=UPI000BBE451F|nr:hypothetical protein [Rhodobacter sp. CZR27]